jgi:thiol-disulfide isomerase/thioredoxin
MKSRLSALAVALGLILASPALAFNFAPSEPTPAPEVAFLDGEGNEVRLADFQGKVVVLNLWATWCAPCRHEMPSLDRLQAQLGGDNLEVVALSMDRGESLDKIKQFFAEVGVEHLAIYRDPKMAASRALRAPGLPTTIVFDKQGNDVGRLLGIAEWDGPEAIALLEAYMAGS